MLQHCLERLLAESVKFKDLRESVQEALETFAAQQKALQLAGDDPSKISADRYWNPFKIALNPSKPVKIRETALNLLQKLIAHNLLRGALPGNPIDSENDIVATSQPTFFGRRFSISHLFKPDDPPSAAAPQLQKQPASLSSPTHPTDVSVAESENANSDTPALETGTQYIESASTSFNHPVNSPTKSAAELASETSIGKQLLQNTFLMDEIISTVISSINNQQSNAAEEALQLQVLQVLLTAVTSTECEVHERSLLRVVQICFAIHANGQKNSVNEVTAKASLTQMVNLIFSRMERYADVLTKALESGAPLTKLPRTSSVIDLEPYAVSKMDTTFEQPQGSSEGLAITTTLAVSDESLPVIQTIKDENEFKSVETRSLDADTELTLESEAVSGSQNTVPLETSLVENLSISSEFLTSNIEAPVQIPPTSPLEEKKLAAVLGAVGLDVTDSNPYNPSVSFYNQLLRKDVYLVLRFLCYMSMHSDDQNQATTFNPATLSVGNASLHDELSAASIKSRILAMELILSVLNNIGPVLHTDGLYVKLVRENLCLSVSRNAVNTNPALFELSLSIFLLVIRYYRDKLKVEVEVLLSTIYLQILEMGNSTYKQKSIVLQGLVKICETPQTLVDLYVNYDCDMATSSVFEKIINICAKITQGRADLSSKSASHSSFAIVGFAVGLDSKAELIREQDQKLKIKGLCALVAAIQSLDTWCQEPLPQDMPIVQNHDISQLLPESTDQTGSDSANPDQAGSLEPLTMVGLNDKSGPIYAGPSSATKSLDGFSDTATAFMDALAPTNHARTVVVGNRNPLLSVTMDKTIRKEFADGLISKPAETNQQDMEQVVSRKQLLRRAVRIFNQSPKKGIQALADIKFITLDPESISEFLLTTPELSKSAIGIYLGEGDPHNIKVMHAFVDALEFSGMAFVAALRFFLQHFRLPGEAQKIDRMMEKFADRYCESNPGVFANADAAYTLAFSVMMLNTDQHSSQIKNRMDKPAFIKNNKGINGDSDLPEEFLDAVFDEIAQNEIIMEEEHANGKLARITMGWGAGDLNDRQRMDMYRKEVNMIQKKSQMLMKAGSSNRGVTPFRSATGRELVRPMFAMAAWALVATFSLLFESAVDEGLQNIDFASKLSNMAKPDLSTLCLRGFSGAIRIACTFKLETERDAFVSSLAKLTSLGNFYNIKPKNVMAIRTLIDLSQDLAESMESSWVQIIKTISQIERMQMAVLHSAQPNMEVNVGSSLRDNRSTDSHKSTSDRSFYSGETTDSGYRSSSFGDHLPKKIPPALEHLVSDFQSQTSLIVIDRIFSKTINLSATAIIHFFRAVCQVSLEEVGIDAKGQPIMTATPGPPRMYLLQKIVEVAHYNVTRIRFEWTQIWRILQPHFSIVACHPNQHVATFAVDSLRQLCMKFLEREELGHFSSQHEYLRSFEWIIRHTTSPAIRELVLQSITHMITAKATSIRSGWKSIFVVLAKAGKGDERLSKIAFSTIQMIFRTYFEDVVSTGGFVDLVSCLAEFSLLKGQGPAHDELVMGSIQLLQSCAKSLVERAKEEYELPNSKPRTKRPSVYPISGAAPTLQSSSASTGVTAGTVSLSSPGAPRINNLPQQAYLMPNGCVSEGHFYLSWFPILSAFSRVVIESEGVLVRTHTLETLFDMLRSASHLFDSKYWRTIHRNIISPIFEDLSDPADEPAFGEANSAVLILGLRLLIEMISLHFDLLVRGSSDNTEHPDTGGQEFIQNSLERILFIMGKKDDKLAATGQICFQQFLLNNVHKLAKQGKWTWLVDSIEEAFKRTLPVELLNCSGPFNPDLENSHGTTTLNNNVKDGYDPQGAAIASLSTLNRDLSQNYIIDMSEIMESAHAVARETGVPLALDDLDFDHTIIKCVTHLELLQTVRDFCLTDISSSLDTVSCTDGVQRLGGKTYAIGVMTAHDRDRILKCVYASYTLARSFNSLTDLRHAIWRRGWVSQLPNLVKQETVSFSTLIVMLFGAYKTLGDSPTTLASTESQDSVGLKEHTKNPVMEALIKQSMDLLERYIVFLGDAVKHSREIVLWSPIVVLFYRELLSTGDWWSQKGSAHSEPTETNDGKSKGVQLKALKKHLPRYFRLAIRMMSVDRLEVRQVLQEFMERVGDEYICMNE
ncbi:hypothetical protein BDV3_007023 [Batrachochytrium dendrobatidis]